MRRRSDSYGTCGLLQRDGIFGVLALAAEDAQWHPHSAHSRTFRSTSEYREELELSALGEERVEAHGVGLWSHGDVVVVRGRMRIRKGGGVLEDTRMYWLFRVGGETADLGLLVARPRRDAARGWPRRPGARA